MRIKLIIILFLLLAIFTAATAGTLSNYTLSLEGTTGFVPDIDKIESMYGSNPNPSDILIPDYSSLPAGVDIVGGLIISNSRYTFYNDYGFVAFTGDIIRTKPNPKLTIGRNNDQFITYLVFFEHGTVVAFQDNTQALFGGFYLVTRNTDILDDELYEINGSERTLKDNEHFKMCTDVAQAASDYGIPLTTID